MKNCLECGQKNKFEKSKYCSMSCYHKQAIAHKKGKNSPFWKGKEATVDSIHDALKTDRGMAAKCTSSECEGKSQQFDWALLRGKRYEDRNHNDYIELCRKCHKKYDFVEKQHKRNKKGIFI